MLSDNQEIIFSRLLTTQGVVPGKSRVEVLMDVNK